LNESDTTELQVGSKVARFSRGKLSSLSVVTGETRFYWKVGKKCEKFRKCDLRLATTDRWAQVNILPLTDEHVRQFKAARARFNLENTQWSSLTDEQVVEAWEFVESLIGGTP